MPGIRVRQRAALPVIHGERNCGIAEAARMGQDLAGQPESRARLKARLEVRAQRVASERRVRNCVASVPAHVA